MFNCDAQFFSHGVDTKEIHQDTKASFNIVSMGASDKVLQEKHMIDGAVCVWFKFKYISNLN